MGEEENEEVQDNLEENELKDGKDEKEEVKATKFQSPVPVLKKVRNLIFGRRIPDMYTQITFYMNSMIWSTFMLWNIISYFTLASREIIWQQKGIPIERIIQERGQAIGYTGDDFISRLMTFHAISIICWVVIFVGLILLFRKSKRSIYFVLGGLIFYIGMCIFYVGLTYFIEDTTAYDKVALLIIVVSTLLHYYLTRNEYDGRFRGFFGETIEADE